MTQDILKTTVTEFEDRRESLLQRFDEGFEEFSKYEGDNELADQIENDVMEFDFLSKLDKLDSVTFIQVDVHNKDNSNQLFGEISKAVSEAIDSEINDISNINDKNAAVQANPDALRKNYIIKKRRVIDETILNSNGDDYEQNLMTLRCMDVYSEMAQTTEAISERTRKKMLEHEQILLFIGVTPKPSPDLSEAQLTEVLTYTIAVASNIRDGTVPDIESYKNKVVDLINNSTNAVISSKDVTATVKSFQDVSSTLAVCKEQIMDSPNGKNFVTAITAIENICQSQQEQISQMYAESRDFEM